MAVAGRVVVADAAAAAHCHPVRSWPLPRRRPRVQSTVVVVVLHNVAVDHHPHSPHACTHTAPAQRGSRPISLQGRKHRVASIGGRCASSRAPHVLSVGEGYVGCLGDGGLTTDLSQEL